MSANVFQWVLQKSPAQLVNRLVLLVLADHANGDGTGAWPSTETIAKEARCSIRSAQYALNALEQAGAIKQTGWSKHGTREWKVEMTRTAARARFAPRPVTKPTSQIASPDAIHGANLAPERSVEPSLNHPSPPAPQGERPSQPDGQRKRDWAVYREQLQAWAPHLPAGLPGALAALWDQADAALRRAVAEPIYELYLADLHPHRLADDALVIGADPTVLPWAEGRFRQLIETAAHRPVVFVPCDPARRAEIVAAAQSEGGSP